MSTKKADNVLQFRTQYTHRQNGRVPLANTEPSMAKQSFKDECDINVIMRNFGQTGCLDHYRNVSAEYGYAPSCDYKEALTIVEEAKQVFDALPAAVRERFANNPAKLLEFAESCQTQQELDSGLFGERGTPAHPHGEKAAESGEERPQARRPQNTPPPDGGE